jgi:hypothetical protein
MERVVPGGDMPMMPMVGGGLPDEQVGRIRAWIETGAKR